MVTRGLSGQLRYPNERAAPSFMVGLPRSTGTSEVASRSEHLAVHVLSQRQHVLAELFGSQTEEEVNKFARCSWRAGPCGMPILDDAAAWFIGRTASRSDVGDYVAYLLEPVSVWAPGARKICSTSPTSTLMSTTSTLARKPHPGSTSVNGATRHADTAS